MIWNFNCSKCQYFVSISCATPLNKYSVSQCNHALQVVDKSVSTTDWVIESCMLSAATAAVLAQC